MVNQSQPVRLRQLVWAAEDIASADALAGLLGLGAPFPDPGVGEFGLENAVFAIGDQFLEIVVPVNPSAPARRFIDRGGEGGYMAIFQTDDLVAARERIDAGGMRRVWNIDLDDISASHIHPADIGAAIVSIDEARPAGSWRWGGPDWQTNTVPGKLTGASFLSPDPKGLAEAWGLALGESVRAMPHGYDILTADGPLQFRSGQHDRLSAFHIAVEEPDAALARAKLAGLDVKDDTIRFCGVDLVLGVL